MGPARWCPRVRRSDRAPDLCIPQWDMYIKQSLYAQYYFALRSLAEQRTFRHLYNATMNPQAPHQLQIEKRTEAIKRDVLALLSKSV